MARRRIARIARRLNRRRKRFVMPTPAAALVLKLKLQVLRRYGAFRRTPLAAARYLLFDREIDNFTYEITNLLDLADHLSTALHVPRDAAWDRLNELPEDHELARELAVALSSRRDRNRRMPFGRRAGWYATVRLLRPKVVVETGVHDGLGATALLRALQRNAAEGYPGVLVSFDIVPDAGWIIPTSVRARHELIIGKSVDAMAGALHGRPIDLFIHDSDHRYEYERRELELASSLATASSVYFSDNAHATAALEDFAADHGLTFSFWREHVTGHFYPGAGIGMAVPPVRAGTDRDATPELERSPVQG